MNWNFYIGQPVLLIDVARNTLGYIPFYHIVILRKLFNDSTCQLDFYVGSVLQCSQVVSTDYLDKPAQKEFDVQGFKKAYEDALTKILKDRKYNS